MPLSITNHLSPAELNTLAHCDLNNNIIAVQKDGQGGSKIITLSKDDVTCWQLFLRFFNAGKLADVKVHLREVSAHLNQYDWSQGANLDPNSEHNQAYLKVCTLANKGLCAKWDETLVNNVSSANIEKGIEFVQYQGCSLLNRFNATQSIRWNPCMQVKHLRMLLEKQFRFRSSAIRIEDEHHQSYNSNTNLSREVLNSAHIYVEQHIIPEVRYIGVPVEQHHCHHYPHGTMG